MKYVIGAFIIIVIICVIFNAITALIVFLSNLISTYWYVIVATFFIVIAAICLPILIRYILKKRYFASEDFLARKLEIAKLVADHNDVTEYVQSISDNGSFEIGDSSTGKQAHLASSENTSEHNYRRDRHTSDFNATNVHNCSLQVVRNVAKSPIKYLMKYFDLNATKDTLSNVEAFGESISRLESAITNLKEREASISKLFAPPAFILKYFHDEFMRHVGVELSPIDVPYPVYVFEYVSAGGNSGQKTTVKLDTPTIDALIETISENIRFRKSAAGQRALMTAKVREFIKKRDKYTCKHCTVSLMEEPHLLLEVDHILPVSKGGLSTEDNLQTLCWRCNRTKSNKVVTETEADAPRIDTKRTLDDFTGEDDLSPVEEIATASPAPTTIPCPNCSAPLFFTTLHLGSNVCPHCEQEFIVE